MRQGRGKPSSRQADQPLELSDEQLLATLVVHAQAGETFGASRRNLWVALIQLKARRKAPEPSMSWKFAAGIVKERRGSQTRAERVTRGPGRMGEGEQCRH
eukprot:761421-Hanusia_phi.AAC.2